MKFTGGWSQSSGAQHKAINSAAVYPLTIQQCKYGPYLHFGMGDYQARRQKWVSSAPSAAGHQSLSPWDPLLSPFCKSSFVLHFPNMRETRNFQRHCSQRSHSSAMSIHNKVSGESIIAPVLLGDVLNTTGQCNHSYTYKWNYNTLVTACRSTLFWDLMIRILVHLKNFLMLPSKTKTKIKIFRVY